MAVYHRVLLKLSGEALKSDKDLFDFDKVNNAAGIIRRMHDMGTEISTACAWRTRCARRGWTRWCRARWT